MQLCIVLFFFVCLINQISSSTWWVPTPKTTWHIQYAGSNMNLNYPVDAYDIDLEGTSQETIATLHANGKKVICYFR